MNNTLKDTHPQKYYMKLLTNIIFYLGMGTFWYEAEPCRRPRLYATWCVLSDGFVALETVDKVLGCLRTDISDEEKLEILQLGCGEVVLLLKFCVLVTKRHQIRIVLKIMLEDCRDIFTSREVEAQAVKKAKIICYFFCIGCYIFLAMTHLQLILDSYEEGMPMRTPPTYFQMSRRAGFPFVLLRILLIVQHWCLICMMLAVDSFGLISLIFLTSKFKQVQTYFDTMGENSEENWNVEDFMKRVITGIKLHENALLCAENVQSALGHLYGMHICLTVVLLGCRLIITASSELTFANIVLNILYIVNINLVTGCYMISAGDITHEAASVAPAVFRCGWERGRVREARSLLVVAMHRAQQPVYMTAFGFLILSHENFINVVRAAYSYFALIYS